jgi:ATP-dependent DNA ligase
MRRRPRGARDGQGGELIDRVAAGAPVRQLLFVELRGHTRLPFAGYRPDHRAVVSKRADAPYAPGNRGLWVKVKCLHREEFVVIGWTDPEGSRPWLGALLLGYYDPDGRLVYAGRAGAGIKQAELERLWRRLQPLAASEMPLDVPPPRTTRFGSPLVLSRVHWVSPELVAEVKYLTWTADNLLRQVVYEGLREDKPAKEVRREVPRPKPGAQSCTVAPNKPVARSRRVPSKP